MRILQGIKSTYYVLVASVGLIVVLALVAKGALIGAGVAGIVGYFLVPHLPINALAYRRRLVAMSCFWLGALVSVGWITFIGTGQQHALENAVVLLVGLAVTIWLLFSFVSSSSERHARTQAKAVFILTALAGLVCGPTVEIELPRVVYMDPIAKHPIFHRPRIFISGNERRSVCKRVVCTSVNGHRQTVFPIRVEHAIRFARPCLGCWPELRRDPNR
jgi:hypothetical protein